MKRSRTYARHSRHAALATLAVVIVASGCASSAPPSAPAASIGAPLDRPVAPLLEQLPLTDDSGHVTNLAAFHGKIIVLTDFLTLCQDVCPMTSANYAQMARSLAAAHLAAKVQFVELTVDPQRDTPARLHAYRKLFDAPPNWSLLTGDPGIINRIWQYFGATSSRGPEDQPAGIDWLTHKPLTYDIDHNDVLVFIDQSNSERFVIDGLPDTAGQQPPPTFRAFLNALGRTHLTAPGPGAWTVPQALTVLSWLTGTKIRAAN